MKITFLTPNLEVHGGNIVLKKYAEYFSGLGHEIEVITSNRPQGLVLDKKIKIKTYDYCKLRYLDFFTFQLIYRNRIAKLIDKTDIIIPIYSPLLLAAIKAKKSKRLNTKIVLLFQDFFEMIWVGRIIRFMLSRKSIKKQLSGIMSVSTPIAKALKSDCGLTAEVIPNGIEHESFFPEGKKEDYILFVGRPQKPKGFPTFRAAVSILQKTNPGLKAKVVSPGNLERLEDGIEYVCYKDRPQIRKLYSQAKVYVCASNGESFGLPPLEAMACGTAVVLTDTVGTREYSRNGENCFVVSVGDSTKLAEKIEKLLSDDKLREKFEKDGLITAKKYNWSKAENQFAEYLDL